VAAGFCFLGGGVATFLLTIALIESSFKIAFNDELTGLPARRTMNEVLLKGAPLYPDHGRRGSFQEGE